MPLPAKNALVMVIDRLGSGFLGPYGNTWIDTPALNQLASESLLVESAVSDSPSLGAVYRSWWSGHHAMSPHGVPLAESLAARLARTGLPTTLLSDDERVLGHDLAAGFTERKSLSRPTPKLPPEAIEETQFAQLTLAALETLGAADTHGLTWIHARAMDGCWDAPLDLRERFRDEEDPTPYPSIVPPRLQLTGDYDPDDLVSVMHAYAAEVAIVDACLGTLLDAFDTHPLSEETLLILTAPRGYPLGEHGWVGASERELFGESLNVPLLVRYPGAAPSGVRALALTQPGDLFATLADWFELRDARPGWSTSLLSLAADDRSWKRQAAFSASSHERAVRTPAWFLHLQNESPALYFKPDDRWEVNEIADRSGDIAAQLAALIPQFEHFLNSGEAADFPPLPKELLEGIG